MDYPSPVGRQIVCSGFIKRDNLFLLVFCPRFKVWRVPGGRSEANETIEQTFIREMKEELGVVINEPLFVGYGQDNQFHHQKKVTTSRLLLFFFADVGNQELSIDPDEAEDTKWVTWDELRMHEDVEDGLSDWLSKNPDKRF